MTPRQLFFFAWLLSAALWWGGCKEHTDEKKLSTLEAATVLRPTQGKNTSASPAEAALEQWPQWRGPLGTGVAPKGDPPIEWSETKNIRWKTALPGLGHSSPVIWGDRIFLTAAIPVGEALSPRYSGVPGAHDNLPITHRQRFVVMAVSRADGRILWEKTVGEALPHEGGHDTGTFATASPATDGEHLIAFFGSYGLYVLKVDGTLLWEKSFGRMQSKHGHGEGSSPVLHGDTVVINWDHEGQSFIAAFDKRTGKELWKVLRKEVTSWASPIVVEHDGVEQVIVSGTSRVRSYDLSSGKVIWECGGLSNNVVASPVAGDGIVYVGSSYETRAMFAIRLAGAKGDITGTKQVIWSRTKRTPYVPSPLLYGEHLYFLRHYQGVLSRVFGPTGEEPTGPFRLDGLFNIYASPMGAAGRVYITDRQGTTVVLRHNDRAEVLARNHLDDRFSASPAAVGRELYLRGERYLYSIGAN